MVGSTAPHPLVLHACWSAGSIHVWAESSLEDFANADDLQAALIAAGFPEESLSGTTVLQLELPKSSGQHIASDRMQCDVSANVPNTSQTAYLHHKHRLHCGLRDLDRVSS